MKKSILSNFLSCISGRIEGKWYIFLLVLLFFSLNGYAQSRLQARTNSSKITGYVFDTAGEPLPGVAIKMVTGGTIGTITDLNGQFTLTVKENTPLEISYLGYQTQTVNAKNGMRVIMSEAVEQLEEVIVMGYGSVKKSDLTGSVASVSAKSFLDQPSSSVNSILAGRAPGVTVRRMNGAPGQESTIRIRGANSLYGGNDPLVVVDGNYGSIPNMYDIESIEILKDASATAIYGSRGANGVILIKTKRGITGKPKVNLYSNFSFDNIPQRYDLMNAYEFTDYNNSVGTYSFTDEEIASYKNNKGTDWQDEILQTGFTQNYKAVISGGTESVKYYVSPAYNKTTGTIINTEASSYGLNTKFDVDISSRVSVQIEANVSHSDNLNPSLAQGGSKTSIPLMGAMVWSPTESVYDEDGITYNRLGIGTGTIINPVLMTTIQDTNYGNSGSGVGNFKIKIIDGLTLEGKGSIAFGTGGSRDFESKNYNGVNATASQSSYESKTWLVNSYLNYNKVFGKVHNISLMGGFEETKSTSQSLSGSANILPIESVGWYNLGLAAPNMSVGSSYSNSSMRSYFGRINYNYASRYYLTANFRADGSSKFKKDNRFGYFPSFSVAWRLSEEQFMKDQDLFQNVKIRGGWGVTGNQAISNYATYTTLGERNYSWGATQLAGYYARVGGNENLKWESTRQMNLGVDFSVLDNRLNFTFDYYDKKTEDLLAPVSVPAYNGADSEYSVSTVISNVGAVQNRGFEFNINYDVLQNKDFSYEINLNGSLNRNKVLDLGEQSIIYGDTYAAGLSSLSPFVLKPGEQIGTIYGLKYLGIWQQDEAVEAAKFQQEPGDYKYEDLNGNYNYDSEDYQVIGHTNPSFTWGFNNRLSYKNFDMNILFEGVHGRDIMNWSYMVSSERLLSLMYTLSEARDRWTETNTDAKFAKIGNSNKLNPNSSQYMEDGSYIKLRNISVAYHFPRKIVPFADLKVSVSAQNILTFTKYKGYDPEISSSAGDDVNSGMDWFAYPNPKSFSFGISLTY